MSSAWQRIKLYEDAGKAAELNSALRKLTDTNSRKGDWLAKVRTIPSSSL